MPSFTWTLACVASVSPYFSRVEIFARWKRLLRRLHELNSLNLIRLMWSMVSKPSLRNTYVFTMSALRTKRVTMRMTTDASRNVPQESRLITLKSLLHEPVIFFIFLLGEDCLTCFRLGDFLFSSSSEPWEGEEQKVSPRFWNTVPLNKRVKCHTVKPPLGGHPREIANWPLKRGFPNRSTLLNAIW